METPSERIIDPVDGTVWQVDMDFMASNWTCIWGRGCEGILPVRSAELGQGCCSVGAELLKEETATIGALGASLDPARFQYAAAAIQGGVYADEERRATRVIDGACIFLNRPGFDGGQGCALHLAAVEEGASPIDWKPAVCWQLPLKVDVDGDGTRRLRAWRRQDWSPGGSGHEPLAWCCTERVAEPSAYVGSVPVIDSLADEIRAVVGPEVAVEIGRRIHGLARSGTDAG